MRINGPLQRYPLLRIALFLMGGIAVGDACYPTLGTGFWLICACVGIALALLSKRAAWRNGCIFVITLTVGATLVNRSEQHADCKLPHGESHYEAIISNTPTLHGKTWRCDLLLTKLNGQPLGNAITVKATVLDDPNRPMQLQTCNGIIASSVLEKPQNRWPNAHFDYALWLRRHGYQAETFIPYWQFQTAEVPMTLGRRQRATLQVRRFRDRIIRHFASSSHADNQDYAILQAMVLGHREAVSKATREAYALSGGSHILALSGLHIGIIFGIFLLVFGRNVFAMTLSILTIWAFAFLVGLPPSVVRSAVMLTIYAFVSLLGRENISLNTLALAALIILIAQPMTLWDVGFQLSFMAVAGILIAYKPLFQLFNPITRLLRWAWGMICVSVSAQLLTFPLLLHYFGRFSTYFLLTNFIVVPAATAILYLAFLTVLSTPFVALQNLIFNAMTTITGWMNTSVTAISRLPYASIDSGHLSFLQTVCLYVFVFSMMGIYRTAFYNTSEAGKSQATEFSMAKKKIQG